MNKDNYKSAMSGVRHSDELTERIMDMTTEKKRTIKMKPVLAVAACLILLVAGIFGGSVISANINAVNPDNMFTITAYAKGKEISLKDSPIVTSDVKLDYQLVDGVMPAVSEASQGFEIDGKNIKSITYAAEHGEFSYTAPSDVNVKVKRYNISQGSHNAYATEVSFEIENDEAVIVNYTPSEAIDTLLSSKDETVDFTSLVNDTITVTVEYKDGTTAKATINTSFDKDGNMQLEYQK